jgi:hypothetical protein
MHLINRYLIGVYLTSVRLIGVYLMGVYLVGVYLMGVYFERASHGNSLIVSAGSYAYILVTVATPPHLDHRRLL